MQWLAIAAGGAVGSALRFWMSSGVYALTGRGFPWGTLAVNVLGSLLIGFLSVLLIERLNLDPVWRAAVLIGLLGGFTTFSTFSLETLNLIEQGALLRAAVNAVSSVLLCLVAAWVGLILARQL
ncbi:MAG: fluoride efflux transporter CrcB [Ectothiorhodospiraceae bacterium]|jgi:CrcB protein|nr:fluoride efflux transporter CrcB [Ectothiorhodospiraceae bacterium]